MLWLLLPLVPRGHRRSQGEPVPVQPIRAHADGLTQSVALVGTGVVVVRTGNLLHLLVGVTDRFEQPAGVTRCAGVIREITDNQRGYCDIGSTVHRVTVGVVETPLRQP